jgi:hypothetical protein
MELIPCTLTDISGNSTQGQAQLATLSAGERLRRALKKFAIIFAASFILLPVPGLHWFPALGLLIAIGYGIKIFRETKLIRHVDGECPSCKSKVSLEGPINAEQSKEICPQCRTLLKLRPVALRVI